MQTLQHWTETNAFLTWLRESSSVWAYPTVFFLHTAGFIFTAGASIVIDARLLGAAPRLPLAPLSRFFKPVWIGFWITAVSGIVMLAADLENKLANRLLPVKMTFVVLAALLTLTTRRRIEGANVSTSTRAIAALSLVSWLGAIAVGKFMAYL